jgi:hypothetical protein
MNVINIITQSKLATTVAKIVKAWMKPLHVKYYEQATDIYELERRMLQVQRGTAPFQQHTHKHIGRS